MGPEILVEGEQALSHGAGQHFQRQFVCLFLFVCFFQVDRLLTTVCGKQKSLVSFPKTLQF